jgi:tetratricopeptide (TPR) repeat protein
MLCHLACLYFEAGELMASEATFHDALDLYRQVYKDNINNNTATNGGSTTFSSNQSICSNNSTGTNNNNSNGYANVMLQLADTLCNVGSIQNRRKRFGKSVESFTEALDLQMKIIPNPETDGRVISTLDNLGYSYSKLKDYASAEKCYRKMFRGQVSAAATAAQSNGHPKNNGGGTTTTSLFSTAAFETFRKLLLVLEKLRKYGPAIEETKDAIQLAKSLLPRDHNIIVQLKDILEDLKRQQQQQQSSSSQQQHYNTNSGSR